MATDAADFDATARAYICALEDVLNSRRARRPRPWRSFLDPHLIEILQKLVVAIDEARFAARCARTPEALAEVAALRGTLDDPKRAAKLSRESAVELLDTVDRMVIRLADKASLHAAAQREAERTAEVEVVTRRVERTFATPEVERAWLLEKRKQTADSQRRQWTRIRLKRRLMWRYAAGITVAVLAAGAAAWWAEADHEDLAVAVSAGALGSAMSGLLKLRDEILKARDIVAFAAIGSAQIAVGAAAGILVLFLVEIGLLGGDGTPRWASIGALAFAAGFSEPFLLGTVRGIAQVPTGAPSAVAREGGAAEPTVRTGASK